jgi:hypothetical protein
MLVDEFSTAYDFSDAVAQAWWYLGRAKKTTASRRDL